MNDLSNDEYTESEIISKENEEEESLNNLKNSQISNFAGFSLNPNDSCDDILAQHLKLQVNIFI
jgi:hypothetical protein